MDVMNAEQAKIAEASGATAVMALERVPSDIRAAGGVARMADPTIVEEVMKVVSIPVMAKARIGHYVEAKVLESLGVDYLDESEVLTPADEVFHIDKHEFTVPFVCGAKDLGEAIRRIGEGASMIRTKGEPGTGNIVEAVRHMRLINSQIRKVQNMSKDELYAEAKNLGVAYELLREVHENGKLPVVNFAAGGVATPADAALMMHLGADGVFVGSALFGNVPADIADEFKKIPVLAEGYVGKEVTIGASPDLVMGRGGLFEDADWGVGTVNSLNDMSIKTYVQTNAAAYVEQLKVREEALKARASAETINYASFSDNGDGTIGIYNGNGDTFIESAMSLINMHNMLIDETGTLSLEKLIEVNPDVMIISRYAGGIDPEETIKKLLANKQVQNINAVKNKKIFIIDFNNFWGYGDSIFTGVEALADDMGL
ncbi:hypothetical protein G195_000092 [Phytophthora kernoviae 00238/432]|uniref:pyridoxal 5'-phosphate synthase (glutamine hydrolyzing) n=1 Tax=Phytophthora kernoviae 00238/432 TaxID=1284355 RepID=A0A8J4SXL9_9STRA|nr:hypothetical protein G195_000092 [Phytophthora kernoviae 00238/432]